MSLSGLLKGCGERERAFQEILRSFLPEPKQFYTASGHKAFSKEYQLRAPAAQALERRDVAFVGTAFTNLAEVMVARAVERGKRAVLSFPLAFKGLELATEKLGSAEVVKQQLKDFFTASVLKVERFVKGGESIEKILPACYYLSKLEQLSGLYQDVWPKNIPAYLKAREQRELVADLERLCGVFNHVFIQSGLAGGEKQGGVQAKPRSLVGRTGRGRGELLPGRDTLLHENLPDIRVSLAGDCAGCERLFALFAGLWASPAYACPWGAPRGKTGLLPGPFWRN